MTNELEAKDNIESQNTENESKDSQNNFIKRFKLFFKRQPPWFSATFACGALIVSLFMYNSTCRQINATRRAASAAEISALTAQRGVALAESSFKYSILNAQKSIEISEENLELAKKSAMIGLRAYVFVDSMTIPKRKDGNYTAIVCFT